MSKKTKKVLTFSDHLICEQVLKDYQQEFLIDIVDLSEIDWEESEANIGRIDLSKSKEAITSYTESMKNGNTFPRILVSLKSDGSKVILSGLHRAKAAVGAKVEGVECYIISCDDEAKMRLIAFECNSMESQIPLTGEERLEMAVGLVEFLGITQKEAAKRAKVSLATLGKRFQVNRLKMTAAKLGFNGTLKDYVWLTMSPISKNHKVFRSCCDYYSSSNGTLDYDQTVSFMRKVKQYHTEVDQIAYIKSQTNQQKKKANKTSKGKSVSRPNNPGEKLSRALKKVEEILTIHPTLGDLHITKGSDIYAEIKKAGTSIQGSLSRLSRERK